MEKPSVPHRAGACDVDTLTTCLCGNKAENAVCTHCFCPVPFPAEGFVYLHQRLTHKFVLWTLDNAKEYVIRFGYALPIRVGAISFWEVIKDVTEEQRTQIVYTNEATIADILEQSYMIRHQKRFFRQKNEPRILPRSDFMPNLVPRECVKRRIKEESPIAGRIGNPNTPGPRWR